jgi:hypothetical protein
MALKTRIYEMYHELALDDSGEKIIDIKARDPISAIHLAFYGINGGTSNKNNWMSDVITKVEVMDGSDQLLSLSLKELQAIHAYRENVFPYTEFVEDADGAQRDDVTIRFGRKAWDPEYYLDPTKHNMPQLKITTDEDVVRAMSATGFLTGSFKVSILFHMIEEGASAAKGFVMAKEVNSFTAADSGDKEIDLPLDYPYLALMLHSTVRGSDIDEVISQIKLSIDNDKFVPLKQYTKYLLHENRSKYGPFKARGILFPSHGDTCYFPLYYNPTVTLLPSVVNRSVGAGWMWSGSLGLLYGDTAGGTIAADEKLWTEVMAGAPHNTVWIPFGLPDDPETYLPAQGYDSVKAILTQAGAYACKVVLLQMRSYGGGA